MAGRSPEVVTTSFHSYPQRQYSQHHYEWSSLESPSRIVYSQSVDLLDYNSSQRAPPMMSVSCSQQQRLSSRHASIEEPSLSTHVQVHPPRQQYVGTDQHTSSNVAHSSAASGYRNTLPNKQSISVCSIPNERYALDAPSSREHENEDDFLVHANNNSLCMCVFDGHDGPRAVKFAKGYMKANIFDTRSWLKLSEIDIPEEMETALAEFIKVTDNDFFKSIRNYIAEKVHLQSQIPRGMKSYQAQQMFPTQVARLQELETLISGGCTAVVAVLTSNRLYVANVGDSRAILAYQERNGSLQVKQLSEDHGVENEQEMQRLMALGLDGDQLKRSGRLGTQENTRSIGDYSIKGGYKDVDVLCHATDEPGIAIPYVVSVNIDHYSFKYLVSMSDGVYKTLEAIAGDTRKGNDVIISMIEQHISKYGWDSNAAANILKRIRQIQYDLYQRSARGDIRSPTAVANRKRDDMTLVIYKF